MFGFLTNLIPGGFVGKLAVYGLLAIGLYAAGVYSGHILTHNAWVASNAAAQKKAAQVTLNAWKQVTAQQIAQAETNAKLEAQSAENQATLDRANAALDRTARQLDRMRLVRRNDRNHAVSGKAVAHARSGQSATGNAGANPVQVGALGGPFSEMAHLLGVCAADAKYADEAHAWALSVGRKP